MYFNNSSNLFGLDFDDAQEAINQVLYGSSTSEVYHGLPFSNAYGPLDEPPLESVFENQQPQMQQVQIDASRVLETVDNISPQPKPSDFDLDTSSLYTDEFWREVDVLKEIVQRRESEVPLTVPRLPSDSASFSVSAPAMVPTSPSSPSTENKKRPRSPENDVEAPEQKKSKTDPRGPYNKHTRLPSNKSSVPFFENLIRTGLVKRVMEKKESNGCPIQIVTKQNIGKLKDACGDIYMCETGVFNKASHHCYFEATPTLLKDYEIVGGKDAQGTEVVRMCHPEIQKSENHIRFYFQYISEQLKVEDGGFYIFGLRHKKTNTIVCEGHLRIFRYSKNSK